MAQRHNATSANVLITARLLEIEPPTRPKKASDPFRLHPGILLMVAMKAQWEIGPQ